MQSTISPAKANNLYWLGRYAERVYASLHMLQKYYDMVIDGDAGAYVEFCQRIGFSNCNMEPDNFILDYLYNRDKPGSIRWTLDRLNDNSILLREDIKSDTLSYVHLSLGTMTDCARRGETNITELQPVIDNMLAFWGSIAERVYDDMTLDLLGIGKHIEYIELHIRFDYSVDRILEAWDHLRKHLEHLMPSACDSIDCCSILIKSGWDDAVSKKALLDTLNSLVNV
ncbi:MAG: alpha-E domain-containing protein [Desulfovibrionaceae bacterium]|nr:alpha-E domain-containing protein [Desulfovibrionaceae bacterium]